MMTRTADNPRQTLSLYRAVGLAAALLAAVLTFPGSARGRRTSIVYPEFGGNTAVDYRWQAGQDHHRLVRDGQTLKTWDLPTPGTIIFHRDNGVTKGETHEYVLCSGDDEASATCSDPCTVTVGEIKGKLYQDLEWASGEYEIYSEVTVQDGITLKITGGAVVTGTGPTAGPAIYDGNRDQGILGTVEVDHATLSAEMTLYNSDSHVWDSVIVGPKGKVRLYGSSTFSDNEVRSRSVTVYNPDPDAFPVDVVRNRFIDGSLTLQGPTLTMVESNDFVGETRIVIYDPANATLDNNTFRGTKPRVEWDSSGFLDVIDNRFTVTPGPDPRILQLSGTGPITIKGNVLQGPGPGEDGTWQGGEGKGIVVSASVSPTVPSIRNNLISGWYDGIVLRAGADIVGNTIIQNHTGIEISDDGPIALTNNCIGDNFPSGLHMYNAADRTLPVAASDNYWGSASGPTHADNPGGTGDNIRIEPSVAGVLTYTPWLESHACPTEDVSIAGLEVVQVVQTAYNAVPLVAGRPTVARLFARSASGSVGVEADLLATRDGQPLTPGLTESGTATPFTDTEALRWQEDGGIVFVLPDDWLTGTVELEVALSATGAVDELSLGNNTWEGTVRFRPRHGIHVGVVMLRHQATPTDTVRVPAVGEFKLLLDKMAMMYPTLPDDVRYTLIISPTETVTCAPAERECKEEIIRRLNVRFDSWNASHSQPEDKLDQIFGLLPNSGGEQAWAGGTSDPRWNGGNGRASLGNRDPGNNVLAHEIGHNLGLYHPCRKKDDPSCCKAYFAETRWPYADGTIQEPGVIVGVNGSLTLVDSPAYDVMT